MNIPMLLAQAVGLDFVGIAILVVVVVAVVGIVIVFVRLSGVNIPGWLVQVFWIVVAAVVCIVAILFIARIAGWR
jgi:hypothetical protein